MDEPLGHRIVVTPAGELGAVDLDAQIALIRGLQDPAGVDEAVAAVLAAPQRCIPPVLFELGSTLFERGRRAEGAFWFYAAQLRARFDANRCADETAAEAVGLLSVRHGAEINPYAFAEQGLLRDTVERVIDWDRATPHDYDQRWINLHGMGAFLGGAGPSSLPAAEWDEIAERTRQVYLQGLDEALDEG
ncbi:hypothetical protein [Pseudonocardia sp. GCM10023141]|uniref:hypothetical protein n=1 Tax=Pseudonocardia sp. GCM10023141 TaxID=3252653 RepID=UPI00361C48DB